MISGESSPLPPRAGPGSGAPFRGVPPPRAAGSRRSTPRRPLTSRRCMCLRRWLSPDSRGAGSCSLGMLKTYPAGTEWQQRRRPTRGGSRRLVSGMPRRCHDGVQWRRVQERGWRGRGEVPRRRALQGTTRGSEGQREAGERRPKIMDAARLALTSRHQVVVGEVARQPLPHAAPGSPRAPAVPRPRTRRATTRRSRRRVRRGRRGSGACRGRP